MENPPLDCEDAHYHQNKHKEESTDIILLNRYSHGWIVQAKRAEMGFEYDQVRYAH